MKIIIGIILAIVLVVLFVNFVLPILLAIFLWVLTALLWVLAIGGGVFVIWKIATFAYRKIREKREAPISIQEKVST